MLVQIVSDLSSVREEFPALQPAKTEEVQQNKCATVREPGTAAFGRVVGKHVARLVRNILRVAVLVVNIAAVVPNEHLLLVVELLHGLRAVGDMFESMQSNQVHRIQIVQRRRGR